MKKAKIAHALEMMGLEGILFNMCKETENLDANIMNVYKRLANKKQEETNEDKCERRRNFGMLHNGGDL